jgi:hypothetical protein
MPIRFSVGHSCSGCAFSRCRCAFSRAMLRIENEFDGIALFSFRLPDISRAQTLFLMHSDPLQLCSVTHI